MLRISNLEYFRPTYITGTQKVGKYVVDPFLKEDVNRKRCWAITIQSNKY